MLQKHNRYIASFPTIALKPTDREAFNTHTRPWVRIAEESRAHTVLSGKYLHLLQKKCSQYLILLRIFSLHPRNICSRKTAQHPPALNFLMDFVKASRSKIRILRDEIWRKTRKILAAGRMSSAPFGYILEKTKEQSKKSRKHNINRYSTRFLLTFGAFSSIIDMTKPKGEPR